MDDQKSCMDIHISASQFEQMLSEQIKSNFGQYYGDIVITNQLWKRALELGFHSDQRVAFRASYALEYAYFKNKEQFTPYISNLLENYIAVTNRSAHRHYSKILHDIILNRQASINKKQLNQLAERAFDHLIDPKSRVAVKVWSMELLYLMSARLKWVSSCLVDVMERQAELTPTPAMINSSKKVLKRLRANTAS